MINFKAIAVKKFQVYNKIKILIKKYKILKKVNLTKELSKIIKIYNKSFSKRIKIS